MEPGWTEPPPFVWVLIRATKRPAHRWQAGFALTRGMIRRGQLARRCEREDAAQGRAEAQPDKGGWWWSDDHSRYSHDGGGRMGGTGATTRMVPTVHCGHRWASVEGTLRGGRKRPPINRRASSMLFARVRLARKP